MRAFTLTVPGEEENFFYDLLQFFENIFSGEDAVYENINFGSGSLISLNNILIGIAIGIIIACISATFNKRVLGELVRQMIYQGAVGKENAKTLEELGFYRNPTLRHSLRKGVTLRSVVKCAEEEEYAEDIKKRKAEYEKKREEDPSLPPFKQIDYEINVATDRFYIPEDKKFSAESRFSKKGSTWFGVVMAVIVCVIGVFAMMLLIPQLLGFLDAAIGSM